MLNVDDLSMGKARPITGLTVQGTLNWDGEYGAMKITHELAVLVLTSGDSPEVNTSLQVPAKCQC